MGKDKNISMFSGVLDAISSNRRKKSTIDPNNQGKGVNQSIPNLDPNSGVENMQQQFLDWQVHKISHDLYTRTIYYDTDRISAYQDFRAMDGTPEIAAALNIIRDECIDYQTVIPLLNGKSKTIEELYQQDYRNFEVYSYNSILKRHEPALCERIAYKGEQDCYKVTFDDDSYIETTSEHLWLLKGVNGYAKTSDLKEGMSIEPFYTNISDENDRIQGCEMILENGKLEYMHRVAKIEYSGKHRTYDLVNVGEHNNFAVLTSDKKSGVFVHNCLTRSERGNILEIYSENKRVKQVLEDLFKNVLNVDFNLRLWIRDLVKYGDYFVMLQIDKEVGIYDFLTLPMEEVHREEGYDGRTSSTRFRWETTGDYFEEWQIAHFRLLEDSRKLPYGRSILDSSRKLWKQLQLAEDAMLVYRITRAPDRRIFYIEVGNLPDNDIKQYMGKVQNQVRKQPIVDYRTGNMTQKYDPENVTEDYWIPIRGDKSSKVETLPGACLSLDTKIELLDGRNLSLSDIIKEYESGKQLWSYSINPKTGELVPGMITWAGVTRKNTDVVKITLDNGESIICTPDHKFPTKFNGEKEAKDLQIGESMWAFNKKFERIKGAGKKRIRNTYEMIYDHNKNNWEYTHRMVANYFKNLNLQNTFSYLSEFESIEKNTIHHYDFNRYNNTPDNLHFMSPKDHFYYHQDNMKNLEKYFGKEKIEQWKEYRGEGINKYWGSISEEKMVEKRGIAIQNFKKGSEKFQEMLKDETFKKAFYEKTSKSLIISKNTDLNRNRQSEFAKAQWQSQEFRNFVIEKQTIKYSDNMLQFVVNKLKDGFSAENILKEINCGNSLFMNEFNDLNKDNKQLKKMKIGFTHNNLSKMMKHFGYKNWKDFKEKVEFFNHKITSVEFLKEKQDTGTITIDGNELYHNYHNFALSCGVFTKNSNLGDIQDIEYLQNKLFAALQVPKAYLNFAESMPGGSTLSQADIRFSRTINSIQEAILLELRRIANVHLYFLGFEDDLENFQLTLTNPSTQQEILKLETMKTRLEVFKEFFNTESTSPSSYTWAMENILGFSKSDIKLMLKQKKVEKKIFAEIDSAVETYKKIGLFDELDDRFEDPDAAAAVAAGGGTGEGEESADGMGGGGGGGLGGGLDLGGGLPPEAGAETDETGEAGETGGESTKEAPTIAEGRRTKFFKQSDKRMTSYINELLGSDDEIMGLMKEKRNIKDSTLFENNKSMNIKTKKLLESLEKNINETKNLLNEDEKIINVDILYENNEKNNLKTKELFDDLDEIIKTNTDV